MSDIAIRVEGLGKRYRIGERERYKALRDVITDGVALPFRKLRAAFSRNGHANGNDALTSDLRPPTSDLFWALKDVSFEVKRGEVVGIIGRNGAGKSTLLKILSRITAPTTGEVEIKGRVGSLLEVGTGFHPELTGRENIYLNAAILGMRKGEVEKKFDEIVAFAEVEKFIDTPVKRYSSGMYVRLAFAVAAHMETEVLLIDEVLAVGDAAFQKKCLGKIGEVAKEGRTVFFVSHNMVAVRTFCERAILLDEGRLTSDGPSLQVVSKYLNPGRVSRVEKVWDTPVRAPGNELFRLHRVYLRDSAGRISSEIDRDQSFSISIEYWNLQAGSKQGATVVLFNDEGTCVFSSLSNNEPRWQGRARPEGLFRSTCMIPGNLLPDGCFNVSVLLWADNYQSSHREDNVVEFEIQEVEGLRGDYFGGWAGVVRPNLAWETDYLQDENDSQQSGKRLSTV